MGCPKLTYQTNLKPVYNAHVAGVPREAAGSRPNLKKGVDTGNYYYGARYYDPQTSVWLSVDPLVTKYPSLSSYAFVANNPIMLVDQDGRDIWRVNNGKLVLYKKTKDNFSIFQNQSGREIFRTNKQISWKNQGSYTVLDYKKDYKRLTRLIANDVEIQRTMEERAEKTGWDDALFSSIEEFKSSREEIDKNQTTSDAVGIIVEGGIIRTKSPTTMITDGVELINEREPIGETVSKAANSASNAAYSIWDNVLNTLQQINNEIKTNLNAIENATSSW